jgi:hypothetical protein
MRGFDFNQMSVIHSTQLALSGRAGREFPVDRSQIEPTI